VSVLWKRCCTGYEDLIGSAAIPPYMYLLILSFIESIQQKQYLQGVEIVISRKDAGEVHLKCVGKARALK
jgi:hypothetical protein